GSLSITSPIHDAGSPQYAGGEYWCFDAATDHRSRARASGCKFVGTFVSDHVAFKGDQDSGLTSWRFLGPPRGGFSPRVPYWIYRSRGGHHLLRVGYVRRECVLHDPARHLDMERLDDHAGCRAKKSGNDVHRRTPRFENVSQRPTMKSGS